MIKKGTKATDVGASPAAELRDLLRQIAKGSVGETPEDRFRWLQRFAASEIRAEDVERWRQEILAFAALGWDAPPVRRSPLRRLADPGRYRPPGDGSSLLDPSPSRQTVELIRFQAARALQTLAQERRCRLTFSVVEIVWEPSGALVQVPPLDPADQDDGALGWFNGAVYRVIAALSHRLRVCCREACKRLFIRTRRQEYCTPLCSTRERGDRYNAKHPNAARAKARRHYDKRIQAKLGKNAKVGQRASRS
jgi:hypothetical protein